MAKKRWQDGLRERLLKEVAALDRDGDAGREDRRVVELDQQSVGRLSRMDALQRQAMAQAQFRRREARKLRIQAALKRMEEGEYGYCVDCGGEIGEGRMEQDPAAPTCIDCA